MKNTVLSLLAVMISCCAMFAQPTSETFPNFAYYDIDGNFHELSSYQLEGKIVIVDIFTTWCPFCVQSLAGIQEIWDLHGPDGDNTIVILKFERDANTDDEEEWAMENGSVGPIITGAEAVIANDWNIPYQPNFFVICPDGSFEHYQGNIGSNADNLLDLAANCDDATNVNDIDAQPLIQMLNNWSSTAIHLKVNYPEESFYEIIDIQGRIHQSGTLVKDVNTIEVSDLSSGSYFLRCHLGDEVFVERIFRK